MYPPAGQGGVTMPGKGRAIARAYTVAERTALGPEAIALLGEEALDLYLDGVAYRSNVPARVWAYTVGGYQVVRKWLSHREAALLGRAQRPPRRVR